MTRIGKSALIFWLTFLVLVVARAEVKVQSLVDRNELALGETFVLSVKITSDQSIPTNQPSLPTIAGVDLLSQSSRSESRASVVSTPQGMDFKNIRTKIYQYEFMVNQQGKINIEPIEVQAGGKSYSTKPIVLNVVASSGALAQKRRPRQRPRSEDDPFARMEEQFNNLLKRHFGGGGAQQGFGGGFQTAPKNKNHAFFILAEVDKTEAYKGEQIVASWYLYTQGTVRDIDTLKYPELKGFWKEDIQISTHLNFESDTVNGLPYKRALLASYALFPIEAGKTKIDSYKAKATIMRGFGFSRGDTQTKASDSIPILVKPLPLEGKPATFTGAVGEFRILAEVADKQVVAHQPFSLKIRFDGRGNAKLIELPELNLPDTVELYNVANESRFFKNGQSFKEFEVLLIPRQAGDLVLPGLQSSAFNPKTGEYVTLSTEPVSIKVLPGAKQTSMGNERVQSEEGEVKAALPDVAPEWDPSEHATKSSPWMGLGLFFFVILLLAGRLILALGWLTPKKDLKDELKERMVSVRQKMGKKDYRSVGIEVTNTVYHVLGEVSGQGGANMELGKILAKTAPSIRREIEEPLKKHMEYFGMLGFGPKKILKDAKVTGQVNKQVKGIEDLMYKAVRLSRGHENHQDG